ncbi:hypothetical protein L916_14908 [Phytophthora nicotianae]|uniref:Uncharacterized protein n=1 Tax=Phytophthora nicotianae TaxID=4792 RepID=W2IG68_PHYNI|nr:hypothetical protein L916_14908 [Phytophthora nicotianae]
MGNLGVGRFHLQVVVAYATLSLLDDSRASGSDMKKSFLFEIPTNDDGGKRRSSDPQHRAVPTCSTVNSN